MSAGLVIDGGRHGVVTGRRIDERVGLDRLELERVSVTTASTMHHSVHPGHEEPLRGA